MGHKQRLRLAREVLFWGHGVCLDWVLLSAAPVFHAHIYPLIIVTEKHAILGYWVDERDAVRSDKITLSGDEIRDLFDRQCVRAIDATCIPPDDQGNPVSFDKAEEVAEQRYLPLAVFGVDLRAARKAGIEPLLPLEPLFYHPYPATKAFTGRGKERAMLTEWFTDPNAPPVLILEAIGGMGKSALAWKWVNDDLLPGSLKPDAVFWWSFYEPDATFDNFVKYALAYFGGKDYKPDLSLGRPWWHLVNLLRERRCLLVLDGVERRLRAYERVDSVYQGDEVKRDPEGKFRECVSPDMQDFLVALLAPHTRAKVLLLTHLTPKELDDREGCQQHKVEPMTKEEAVAYFRARGITEEKAMRAEIEVACDRYGYHPLALTLLVGAVLKDPKLMGDIRAAEHIEIEPNLRPTEPHRSHHILELAYNVMTPELQQFLSQLAALRFGFDYQMVEDIFGEQVSDLRGAIVELEERGFLMRDTKQKRFDMHHVVRRYCYDRLADKTGIHSRLRNYFAAIPLPRQVQSLQDVAPAIEHYYHTACSGRYDEAGKLFHTSLFDLLFYQLGAYQTCVQLLKILFPEPQDRSPSLQGEVWQAMILNELANSYSLSGKPSLAIPLFEDYSAIFAKRRNTYSQVNRAIGLGNLAVDQIRTGNLLAAERNLQQATEICQDIEALFQRLPLLQQIFVSSDAGRARQCERAAHWDLAQVLAYRGEFEASTRELDTALDSARQSDDPQSQRLVWMYRAFCALFMRDTRAALEAVNEAEGLANAVTTSFFSIERDIIRVEWLRGAAERECGNVSTAETYLTAALTRCRHINLMELEAQILLERARLRRLQGKREEVLQLLQEALGIANRCEYRLQQADIHNFVALFYLDEAKSSAGSERQTALARAREHAEKGKERAWCDGPPHCYKPALDEAEQLLKSLALKPAR